MVTKSLSAAKASEKPARSAPLQVAYFVHDLRDPAVARRVRMLTLGGASVTVLGFTRGVGPIEPIEGLEPICLGYTRAQRLLQRILAVFFAMATSHKAASAVTSADVILARQLEMLAVAALCRARFNARVDLFYECLDIHRLMVGPGLAKRVLRGIEARLLSRCGGLIVSSPAFLRNHFLPAYQRIPPAILVENKVLAVEFNDSAPIRRDETAPAGPPWRIGWFGVIRCQRSLYMLAELAIALPGRIEVIIRGRPAYDVVPDFNAVVEATPGLRFLGPYDRSRDLMAIYGEVHFTWALDFYEAGMNSAWLLPNRLYEGTFCGAIPIAEASVETGRWMKEHGVGVMLDPPLTETLIHIFDTMDEPRYRQMVHAVNDLVPEALSDDQHACEALVDQLDHRTHPPQQ